MAVTEKMLPGDSAFLFQVMTNHVSGSSEYLIPASTAGYDSVVRLLLNKGVDPNTTDLSDSRALIYGVCQAACRLKLLNLRNRL